MNRLHREKSPYLLQHAQDPVAWYTWEPEAFAKAREEDRPIFLSIGYSTCHWCHVMAHESFADPVVADALNRDFIAIKVDREERPDIDAVYMDVCQALTGSGGWPLTILMTPEQKPFFAGTYFPKTSRYGQPGLLELLRAFRTAWRENREDLLHTGEQITEALQKAAQEAITPTQPSWSFLEEALSLYQKRYDPDWGGFGSAPKFPSAHHLIFLLQYRQTTHEASAQTMALHTLEQMYRGGLFDHIGGGFSRYSTDEKWLLPHFEKMLYDNALLAKSYLIAWQLTKEPLYENVARRTLDYVLSELTTKAGSFICAQDADSQGVEGQYYLLTPEEVLAELGTELGADFNRWYDLTPEGHLEGKSLPNLLTNPLYREAPPWAEDAQQRLQSYRQKRSPLHTDSKVLTSWNGLMIATMAQAGYILNEPRYHSAAIRAQRFIQTHLTTDDGRLLLRWSDGEAKHPGQLEDYAFYGLALLTLYETTWDPSYLQQALTLAHWLLSLFADEEQGGFFLYAHDSEALIIRPKEAYDGALPSGNAAAALLLTRLAHLTAEKDWQQAADAQLAYLTGALKRYPAGSAYTLLALLETLAPAPILVITASEKTLSSDVQTLLRSHTQPLNVLAKTPSTAETLTRCAPFLQDYPLPEHGEVFYLCHHGACTAPIHTVSALHTLLSGD